MGFRRLRGRLDALQSDAHATMSEAQQLLVFAQELVKELEDGFDVTFYRKPEAKGTLLEWFRGDIEECPMGIRIKPVGEDESTENPVTTQ